MEWWSNGAASLPYSATPVRCEFVVNLWNAIVIGFKEIWAHKFRSLLTMLGIILGVSSLVAMSALVKGMENGMKEALIAIGGLEKVRVEEQDIPVWQQHLADQAVGTTLSDVHALIHSAPLVTMEAAKPVEVKTGPERSRGFGGMSKGASRSTGGFVFDLKNNTVYIPLNTMWLRFRAATGVSGSGSGSYGGRSSSSGPSAGSATSTEFVPDPRLSTLSIKIADIA